VGSAMGVCHATGCRVGRIVAQRCGSGLQIGYRIGPVVDWGCLSGSLLDFRTFGNISQGQP
ncbi:hypothetical protein, partial [Synechococcus sp. R3-13]|uniref:hypothetical protein n=1 Tax=Synechococcus sp. R3-13 TaxID=2421316 RepID=UPI0039C3F1FA